jgi:hypothetical protein
MPIDLTHFHLAKNLISTNPSLNYPKNTSKAHSFKKRGGGKKKPYGILNPARP